MKQCSQHGCKEIAAASYVWPNRQRLNACRPHLLKAMDAAWACGVELADVHVFTLDELTSGADDTGNEKEPFR